MVHQFGDKIKTKNKKPKELIKKMTEIKKLTKISIVIYAIIHTMFGILLVFATDMIVTASTGRTNPMHPRAFGAICLLTLPFAIIFLRKKEWEVIKFTFAYLVGWCLSTLIIEVAVLATFGSTFGASIIQSGLGTIIIEAVLLTLGIVSYIKQRS